MGHSSGEIAAAYACGAISAEAAIVVAAMRVKYLSKISKAGAMAAIGLSRDEVQPYLSPGLVVACENSHCNVTISGDSELVTQAMSLIEQDHPNVLARLLRVRAAFHSRKSRAVVPEYGH